MERGDIVARERGAKERGDRDRDIERDRGTDARAWKRCECEREVGKKTDKEMRDKDRDSQREKEMRERGRKAFD